MLGKSTLSKRVLSSLIGIPLILLAGWYGGINLLLLIAIIMVLGLLEMSYLLMGLGVKTKPLMAFFGGGVLLFAAYTHGSVFSVNSVTVIVLFYLIIPLFYKDKANIISISLTLFSTLYIGLITYIYLIRNLTDGFVWLLLLLACTWASDTLAYFGGKKLGRVKLAPQLSPGKTREGALSGVLGSLLTAFVFTRFYEFVSPQAVLPLGVMVAVAGQAGDLVQSAIKREAGVKDTGKIIPGHGGILDRFDSMLFAAPLVYYYVGLFIIS